MMVKQKIGDSQGKKKNRDEFSYADQARKEKGAEKTPLGSKKKGQDKRGGDGVGKKNGQVTKRKNQKEQKKKKGKKK